MNRQKLTTAAVNLAWAAIAALMWLPSSHAELTATPEEHDFGEVTLGESSTAYVTITNVVRRSITNEQIVIVAHPSPSFSSSLYLEFVDIEHSEPEELVVGNGALFFAADDGEHGMEIWKSDGTAEGTAMVKDLWPGPNRSVTRTSASRLTACGGAVYFTCDLEGDLSELCRSDGTELGTGLVADINPGGHSSPRNLSCWDGTLYFGADDGTHGMELWRSDGTPEGTYMVADIHTDGDSRPNELVSVNGVLYFVATDEVHGRELWRTDGTAAGTSMVKDIYPGLARSVPTYLTPFQEQIYFRAYDLDHGIELWRSNGTEEGTVLVKDIRPGNPSPHVNSIYDLTVFGENLFFAADDEATGNELWKTDGTEEGTVQVADIIPGEVGSYPFLFTEIDGALLFRAAPGPDRPYSRVLWRTDGTTEGTVMVKDVAVSGFSMTAIGNTVYFQGRDELSGYELWKSDGTEEGTVLVRDIDPGDSSYPDELTVFNGILYFVAYDPLYSRELFRSDGSYLGTHIVHDVRPGGDPSIEVDVTFTPTAVGPASGFLHVIGYENDVRVPLAGFGVAAIPTPEELIVEILTNFDAAVTDGTLVGSGPGASAAGRLGALRNMLVAAQALIDAGDVAAACTQLLDAFHRTDGEPIPPDFVQGDSAPLIASMIQDLRDLLACE